MSQSGSKYGNRRQERPLYQPGARRDKNAGEPQHRKAAAESVDQLAEGVHNMDVTEDRERETGIITYMYIHKIE